jgi:hypothetical protein
MTSWEEFEQAAPEMAAMGLGLFREHSIAFLGTTRRDGSPQLHPVCPYVVDGHLYLFVVNLSTKYGDLLRDGRYGLHALPGNVPPRPLGGCATGDEFLVSGRARPVEDRGAIEVIKKTTGAGLHEFEVLFELTVEKCLAATWSHSAEHGDWPDYRRWKAG